MTELPSRKTTQPTTWLRLAKRSFLIARTIICYSLLFITYYIVQVKSTLQTHPPTSWQTHNIILADRNFRTTTEIHYLIESWIVMTAAAVLAESMIQADVRMISGCEDVQTSADVTNVANFKLPDPAGLGGGACTSALLQALYNDHQDTNADLSFEQVLLKIRENMRQMGLSQVRKLVVPVPTDMTCYWLLFEKIQLTLLSFHPSLTALCRYHS